MKHQRLDDEHVVSVEQREAGRVLSNAVLGLPRPQALDLWSRTMVPMRCESVSWPPMIQVTPR